MEKRSHEGLMEWEYQGEGPTDPNSPFTRHFSNRVAAGTPTPTSAFASPVKNGPGAFPFKPFAPSALQHSTPSKATPLFGSASNFNTPEPKQRQAPPFRNPLFHTPQQAPKSSLFSGTESSPSVSMTTPSIDSHMSDAGSEIPEGDRTEDSFASSITSPRIDKRLRYLKQTNRTGKGEIPRLNKEFSQDEVIRHRRRQVLDRDQKGARYRPGMYLDGSDYDSEDPDTTILADPKSPAREKGSIDITPTPSWMGRLLQAMEDYPNAPEHFYRWIQVCFNLALFMGIVMVFWQVIGAVKSDLDKAHAAARSKSINEMNECTTNYIENRCGEAGGPVPYLRDRCLEWDVCMQRDVDAVMNIRVVIRELAEIVNEFSGTMQFRSWLFIAGLLFVAIVAANLTIFRNIAPRHPTAPPAQASAPAQVPYAQRPGDHNQGFMFVPLQTPSSRRHMQMMDDGSEFDEPRSSRPQRVKNLMMHPHTPSSSSRRAKHAIEYRDNHRERSRSPRKRSQSPSKRSQSPSKRSQSPSKRSKSQSKRSPSKALAAYK